MNKTVLLFAVLTIAFIGGLLPAFTSIQVKADQSPCLPPRTVGVTPITPSSSTGTSAPTATPVASTAAISVAPHTRRATHPRVRFYIMLRSQLLRTKPDGKSKRGPLMRFGDRIWPHGVPRQGWQYIIANRHRRGRVLAANIRAVTY